MPKLLKVSLAVFILVVIPVFNSQSALAVLCSSPTLGTGGNGGAGGGISAAGSNGANGTCGTNAGGGGGGGGGSGSAAGGAGTSGAGGGVLLEGNVSISGTIDTRGGGNSITNGGTVKIFHTGSRPSTSGITSGRTLVAASCVPTTAVDDSSIGNASWGPPANALVQDGAVASASSPTSSTAFTHYLKITGCSLSVPTGSSISGVRVAFYKDWIDSGFGTAVSDNAVRLVKGGTIQSTDRSGTPWSQTRTWDNYGGSSDLWGTSLTPSDVNSSSFGVALSATVPAQIGWGTDQAEVDATQITVYYVPNNPPAAPTLVYPVSSSSGNTVFTTFKLRSSDQDNDYLQYWIDVCSDNACNSIIRSICQTNTGTGVPGTCTPSQTGWAGQDQQAGTAYTGNSVLTSSTLATHSYQSPYLSANTSYFWRAYAIDPGGSNTWSSASTIQSFTTAPTETHIQGNVQIKGNVQF